MTARDQFVYFGYSLGWGTVRKLNERTAYRLFDRFADRMWRKRGPSVRQYEKNIARVVPGASQAELADLSRECMHSYARYWCDAFRMPDWSRERLLSLEVTDLHYVTEAQESGRGPVIVCPHAGNYDFGAAFLATKYGALTTIAERLKPEKLFENRRLEKDEFEQMKDHVRQDKIGAILDDLKVSPGVREIVLNHHERPDGKGYPSGLSGENIPPLARIVAVADAFDAMTSPRFNREGDREVDGQAMKLDKAVSILRGRSLLEFVAPLLFGTILSSAIALLIAVMLDSNVPLKKFLRASYFAPVVVPIHGETGDVACLCCLHNKAEPPFDEFDLEIARVVAAHAGVDHDRPALVPPRRDGDDVAEMFDRRGNRHRNQEDNCVPVPFREHKARDGEGRRSCNRCEIDQRGARHRPDDQCRDITGNHTGEHRDDTKEPAAEQGDDDGCGQCNERDGHGRRKRNKLNGAVTGLSRCHVDGNRSKDKPDHHNDRTRHDGRKVFLQKSIAAKADDCTQKDVDETCRHEATQSARNPPIGDADRDRRDKGERRSEEDRHLSARNKLEQERTEPGGEQSHIRVQPGQKRNKDKPAKCDEHHLPADQSLSGLKTVVGIRVAAHNLPPNVDCPRPQCVGNPSCQADSRKWRCRYLPAARFDLHRLRPGTGLSVCFSAIILVGHATSKTDFR